METTTESQRWKQKADTRSRIIKSALTLFKDKGFVNWRTQELANNAEVSHGLLFAHFGTRDDLILAVANHFLSEIDSVTRKTLHKSETLKDFFQAHLSVIAKYEKLYTRLIQEKHFLPQQVQALITEINSAVASHMFVALKKERISCGLKEKEFFFIFNIWIGLVHHYIMNASLFSIKGNVIHERSEEIIELFLKIIHKTEG